MLETTLKAGTEKMAEKMKWDFELIRQLDMGIDERVPWTNRRIESSFGSFKELRRKNMGMSEHNQADVTRARMNRTVAWMSQKTIDERMELMKKSAAEKQLVRERRQKERKCWEEELVNALFENLESLI